MKQRKRDVANEKPRYQPTEQEQSALRRQVERLKAATPAPRLKVSSDSKAEVISLDHPDIMVGSRLLAEALGTADHDFAQGIVHQLAKASSRGPSA
jgi:hypothetical protein